MMNYMIIFLINLLCFFAYHGSMRLWEDFRRKKSMWNHVDNDKQRVRGRK